MPRKLTITPTTGARPDVAGGCIVIQGFQGPVHVCEAGAWLCNIATDQAGVSYGQVIMMDGTRMGTWMPMTVEALRNFAATINQTADMLEAGMTADSAGTLQ